MTQCRPFGFLLLLLQFQAEILRVAFRHRQLVLEHGVGGAQVSDGRFGLRQLPRGAMQLRVDVVFVLV